MIELMKELFNNGKTVNIKLLGDSITHGAAGTGYIQDGDPIVEHFRRNPNGYCWAKLFKEYIEEKYGCAVVNNGCSGTRIQFIIKCFDGLVNNDDDLIICMIGTNNRHQSTSDGERQSREEWGKIFHDHILQLNAMLKEKGKKFIFMANIPASKANEEDGADYWRILHMDDINAIYKATDNRFFYCNYLFMFDQEVAEGLVGFAGVLFNPQLHIGPVTIYPVIQPIIYATFVAIGTGMFYLLKACVKATPITTEEIVEKTAEQTQPAPMDGDLAVNEL